MIHQSGRGINFVEALARNLVRFIDTAPSFYAVGLVAMFLSKRSQRLGDMVAGTLVVRDREIDSPHWAESTSRTITAPTLAPLDGFTPGLTSSGSVPPASGPWANPWGSPPHLRVVLPAPALAKLSAADLEVLESFFTRRLDMDLTTRAALAGPHRHGSLRQVGPGHSAGYERGNFS